MCLDLSDSNELTTTRIMKRPAVCSEYSYQYIFVCVKRFETSLLTDIAQKKLSIFWNALCVPLNIDVMKRCTYHCHCHCHSNLLNISTNVPNNINGKSHTRATGESLTILVS